MTPKKDESEITIGQALKAIERANAKNAMWMMQAHSLLQLASQFGKSEKINFDELARRCAKHAEEMP